MEDTSMANHMLVLVFGILGDIASLITFASPWLTFYKIYKEKSVFEYRVFPYIVSLLSQLLWLYYGILLQRERIFIIVISAIGCVVQTTYLCIYTCYAPAVLRRQTIWLIVLLDVALFLVILIITFFGFKYIVFRQMVVGWCCVAVSVVTFAAPLTIAWQVIQSRSVQYMPFTLSFALTLNASLWLAYGLASGDRFIQIPNILGMVLGVIQMVIYCYYRYLDALFVFMWGLRLYL